MKRIIKEGLIGIAITVGATGFFLGAQLLNNYANYGTFIFS